MHNDLRSQVDERLLGTVFADRYRIEDVLGHGGMGTVYRATQLAIGRPIALKILNAALIDDETEVQRFHQEARVIAALEHPNAIKVIDFGEADGMLFIAMEYLEGELLTELIAREAPLGPWRVMSIARQILEVLAEAHEHGIIHRDLKPENVFLKAVKGKTDFVKVLDFGIAKVLHGDEGGPVTAHGVALGSPQYMSPEQCRSEPMSAQTDLYALGIVIYEMLTGEPLFVRDSDFEYLRAHINAPPRRPAVDGVPLEGPLTDLVLQCLSKRPGARPASAGAAIDALDAIAASDVPNPPSAPQVRPGARVEDPTRKRARARAANPRSHVVLGAGVAVVVAVIVAWLLATR